ncbi:MAG: ShlB/FhaC/HecB family hemolysin secretion/activation protein [Panacagrimonas sp.]
MPIALPPPPEPVAAPLTEIRALAGEPMRLVVGGTRVLVLGSPLRDAAKLQEAAASAQTLSDVVRQLQAAFYAEGYPALVLCYAVDGNDLYVGVLENRLTGVESPPRYASYWSGLEGVAGPRDSELEPRRFLASLHADRAGEALQMAWKQDAHGLDLSLAPSGEGPDQTNASLAFGNPGNRFTGRYFADAALRHSWRSGDEANLRLRSAVGGLNSADTNGELLEAAAGLSRVTSLGVFAASLGYSRYDFTLALAGAEQTIGADARLDTAEVSWSGLLSAGFAHRWALGIKADYVGKELSDRDGGQVYQRQAYGSGEVSTEALATVRILDWPLELRTGLALRRGLGDDRTGDPMNGADQGYLLLRPHAEIRTAVVERAELSLRMTGQFTDDRLPEQQQWVMGGPGNVEAFLPGLAVGDSGALLYLGLTLPEAQAGRLRLKSRLFAEQGQTRFEAPEGAQTDAQQAVTDAGVSLEVLYRMPGRALLQASVSVAKALNTRGIDRPVRADADAGVYFQLALRY